MYRYLLLTVEELCSWADFVGCLMWDLEVLTPFTDFLHIGGMVLVSKLLENYP